MNARRYLAPALRSRPRASSAAARRLTFSPRPDHAAKNFSAASSSRFFATARSERDASSMSPMLPPMASAMLTAMFHT